jgi:hypothetical protein
MITLAMAALLASQDKPADWAQFRGAGGLGASAAKGLPVTWSDKNNVVWKTPLPGPGASSPVAFGERIFVTSYTGYTRGDASKLARQLLCLGRKDGKIAWTREIPAALPEEPTNREEQYASSTPAVDKDRVYAFFGKSGVHAFDHAGKPIWKADVGSTSHGWGSAASPVLFQDLVIINACVESGSLVALEARTGKERWRASGIKESWNTPLLVGVGGKTELVVAIQGRLLAFDPASGAPLWSCDTNIAWYMVPSLVAHQGVVYCIGGKTGGALAVRAGGRGDVTGSHRLWTGTKGSNVPSPVFHDGHLYWANESTGTAMCAEAATGRIVYEQRLERADGIYASPVLGEGKLYYLARNGRTFVVAASPQFSQLAMNDVPDAGRCIATPSIVDGRLLLRSDRFLYCIGGR